VLELADVPVIVLSAGDAPGVERYGVPAGIGAAFALLLYAASE
jgi:hypothetical protein